MTVHRKQLYIYRFWKSTIDLGRTVPRLTTLAVMSLGYRRAISAPVMFMYISYMWFIEDMFCFTFEMALRLLMEAVVSIDRSEVGLNFRANTPTMMIMKELPSTPLSFWLLSCHFAFWSVLIVINLMSSVSHTYIWNIFGESLKIISLNP